MGGIKKLCGLQVKYPKGKGLTKNQILTSSSLGHYYQRSMGTSLTAERIPSS